MDAVLWQLLDSAFPAGGYTRSGGLEAAAAMQGWKGEEGVGFFLDQSLLQAAGLGLPLVNLAWDAPERLDEWNALAVASTPNAVALQASQAQGRALLEAVGRVFDPVVIEGMDLKGAQHAPVTGALLRRLGCDRDSARRAFIFWALRDAASAAVRLGLLGAYAAQRLQQRRSKALEDWVQASDRWGADDIAAQAPLMDLWQGGHARLERRLFQS